MRTLQDDERTPAGFAADCLFAAMEPTRELQRRTRDRAAEWIAANPLVAVALAAGGGTLAGAAWVGVLLWCLPRLHDANFMVPVWAIAGFHLVLTVGLIIWFLRRAWGLMFMDTPELEFEEDQRWLTSSQTSTV